MGLEQVSGTTAAATPVDYERFRLRAFVKALDGSELERRGACKLSEVARVLDANPRAALFHTPGGPLVGKALASRSRFAAACGVLPQKLVPEILRPPPR